MMKDVSMDGKNYYIKPGSVFGVRVPVRIPIGTVNMMQQCPSPTELEAAMEQGHDRLVAAYEVPANEFVRQEEEKRKGTP